MSEIIMRVENLTKKFPVSGGKFHQFIEILPGEIPSPLNMPSGCPFQNRCVHCKELCQQKKPDFNEIEPNHFVACHYPLENLAN